MFLLKSLEDLYWEVWPQIFKNMKKKNLYQLVKQSLKEVLQEQRRDRRLGPDDFFVDPQTGELTPKDLVGAPTNTTTTTTLADPIKTKDIGSFDIVDLNDTTPSNPLDNDGDGFCDQTYPYNDITVYINDHDGGWGAGYCQTLTLPTDFICCHEDNNTLTTIQSAYTINAMHSSGNEFAFDNFSAGSSCFPDNLLENGIGGVVTFNDLAAYYNNIGESLIHSNGSFLSADCEGCTYDGASNYNELATLDNATCEFEKCATEGFDNYFCIEFPTLCNTDNEPDTNLFASLTDDGSCVYNGCLTGISPNDGINSQNYVCITLGGTLCDGTDPSSTYDTSLGAFNDDGSCIFLGCMDNDPTTNFGAANNYQPDATNDNGTCEYTILGCTDSTAFNPTPNANEDDGSCLYVACGDVNAVNFNTAFTLDIDTYGTIEAQNADLCVFDGCLDPFAANYSVDAVENLQSDGGDYATIEDQNTDLCEYPGCLDPTAVNYDDTAILDNNEDNQNVTYSNAAEQNEALCQYSGCIDDTSGNNTDVDGNGGYLALNYDPNAVYDDTAYPDGEASQNEDLCDYAGCTDDTANNFNPQATVDDGSCDYDLDDDGVDDDEEEVGCQDPTANNYNELATDPGQVGNFTSQDYFDGGCTYTIEGCTDLASDNYLDPATLTLPQTANNTTIINPQAGTANDPCLLPPGCTDSNALPTSYVGDDNVAFTTDDGSCVFGGCTNELANNLISPIVSNISLYSGITPSTNPTNFTDDGSCTFDYCSDSNYGNYVCVVEPSLCIDPTQGNLQCASPCPDGIFNPDLGTINPDINLCEVVTEYCPDPLAFNGPAPSNPVSNVGLNEQTNIDTANTAMCRYRFCNDDNAYNVSDFRPDGDPWNLSNFTELNGNVSTHDIVDNTRCEYVGCADPTLANGIYDQSTTGNPSTVYTTINNLEIYYYHSSNAGCETDPLFMSTGQGNSLQPTGNLLPINDGCCPTAGLFGCTDNGSTQQNGAGIIFGQQEWQAIPDPSSGVTDSYATQTGITAYPFNTPGAYNPNATIGSPNYNPDAEIDDGTCEYNIGCYDSEAYNGDPSNQFDTQPVSSCKYCKTIKAVQCNPDVDPNGYANMMVEQIKKDPTISKEPLKGGGSGETYEVTIECATIGGEDPQVGDEFLYQGVQFTAPGQLGEPGEECPDFYASNILNPVAFIAPPFGIGGYDGEIRTCGGSNPCPGGLEGCTYQYNAGSSTWSLYPPNTIQTYGDQKEKRPERTNLPAVFRVTNISPSTANPTDLTPYSCGQTPPSGGNIGIGIGNVGVELPSDKIRIREVEISKKLRKSLTEMFKRKK